MSSGKENNNYEELKVVCPIWAIILITAVLTPVLSVGITAVICWHTAKQRCEATGVRLASIESQEEQDAIVQHIHTLSESG